MTGLTTSPWPDPATEDGVRFALRATGLLARFGARGVLAPANVAVARRLAGTSTGARLPGAPAVARIPRR